MQPARSISEGDLNNHGNMYVHLCLQVYYLVISAVVSVAVLPLV
jgi:hypothetical protein